MRRSGAMLTLIPGLRGSLTHQISADLYQNHRDTGLGRCACCARPAPCPARQHAISVLVAAGDDPHRYDSRAPRPADVDACCAEDDGPPHHERPELDQLEQPGYGGYALGGRGRHLSDAGFTYERDNSE
jgi:hypothetical protein